MRMSTIAYIDHSYHQSTLSTDFIPEILRRFGHTVDFFWDNSWQGGNHITWHEVESYDAVIMFQSLCPINSEYYRDIHPNVIYIPMLDQFGIWQGPLFNLTEFFNPFHGCKILNFSYALHGLVTGLGIKSKLVKYYQPVENIGLIPTQGLHGFLWIRREEEISWKIVKALIAESHFDSFHIHLANDPGTAKPIKPSSSDIEKYNITMSTWFKNKSDFKAVLEKANVYFAPRMEEGIGQSFLEAFSRGQCVIAPDNGTMNEYIINGINGLLYDAKKPAPLNLENSIMIGACGREAAAIGRLKWESNELDIVNFILNPNKLFYTKKYRHDFTKSNCNKTIRTRLKHLSHNNFFLRKTRNIWQPIYQKFKK